MSSGRGLADPKRAQVAAPDLLELLEKDIDRRGRSDACPTGCRRVPRRAGRSIAQRGLDRRETSRARLLLAEALVAKGRTNEAMVELRAACSSFESLGARLDADRATQPIASAAA
jgi:hypothetical protein